MCTLNLWTPCHPNIQNGWTGIVAKLTQMYAPRDPKRLLEVGKEAGFIRGARAAEGTGA